MFGLRAGLGGLGSVGRSGRVTIRHPERLTVVKDDKDTVPLVAGVVQSGNLSVEVYG